MVVIFFFFFINIYLYSNESVIDISGQFKNNNSIVQILSNDTENSFYYAGKSLLRFNFVNTDKEFYKIDTSIDFNLLYGLYANIYSNQQNKIIIEKDVLLLIDIRKLYLNLKSDYFDLFLGRQLIKFGEGLAFSPMNPFSLADYTDINFSRNGVDGIRLKIPIGSLNYLEAILLPDVSITNSDIFGRFGFNLFNFDFSLVGFYRGKYDYFTVGLSFKGDLLLSLYGELVYNHKNDTNNSYSVMMGFDYSFFEKFLVRFEYYFHNYDTNNMNLISIINSPVYPFVSKQYMMAQFTIVPAMNDSIIFSLLNNLDNDGILLNLLYQKYLYQNLNLLLNIYCIHKDLTGLNLNKLITINYSIELNVRY